jgi:hypothetical protein
MAAEITLPLQSQNVFNLMLGYDDGRLDLRAALSYRDDFIDELGGEAAEDRIVWNTPRLISRPSTI